MNANTFQKLFYLSQETNVEDRASQVNVSEVPRTLCHAFTACLTLIVPVDGA